MSYSGWILFLYTLWLPASLLAQPVLVSGSVENQVDTVHMGMAVFGKVLGIHGIDTLALQGDLILVEAEIVGSGILSLCGRRPQRIIAKKSSVQNLHIANPTKVIVQGDLSIQKSLVIEKGVFDSRMANLMLSNRCRFQISKEGQILWQKNRLLVKQASTVPQSRPVFSITWVTVNQDITNWERGQLLTSIQFTHQPFRWSQQEYTPPSPPPEPSNKTASISRA